MSGEKVIMKSCEVCKIANNVLCVNNVLVMENEVRLFSVCFE